MIFLLLNTSWVIVRYSLNYSSNYCIFSLFLIIVISVYFTYFCFLSKSYSTSTIFLSSKRSRSWGRSSISVEKMEVEDREESLVLASWSNFRVFLGLKKKVSLMTLQIVNRGESFVGSALEKGNVFLPKDASLLQL